MSPNRAAIPPGRGVEADAAHRQPPPAWETCMGISRQTRGVKRAEPHRQSDPLVHSGALLLGLRDDEDRQEALADPVIFLGRGAASQRLRLPADVFFRLPRGTPK